MRYLPLLLLFGCAALKPLPSQSLDCATAEASPANAIKAAACVAQGGGASVVEACYLSLVEFAGLDILQCEAMAIWGDLHHAQNVATTVLLPSTQVQLNAQAYLQAKGVAVTHP